MIRLSSANHLPIICQYFAILSPIVRQSFACRSPVIRQSITHHSPIFRQSFAYRLPFIRRSFANLSPFVRQFSHFAAGDRFPQDAAEPLGFPPSHTAYVVSPNWDRNSTIVFVVVFGRLYTSVTSKSVASNMAQVMKAPCGLIYWL
jgi:hypothetical protein